MERIPSSYEAKMLKIRERIKAKEQAIAELQYELSLLKAEEVRIAHTGVNDQMWMFVRATADWIRTRVNKTKACPGKTAYRFLMERLADVAGIPIKEITDITGCGLGTYYACSIQFVTSLGDVYCLYLPNYSELSAEDLEATHYGRYRLTKARGPLKKKEAVTIWDAVWEGYDIEELKEYFKGGL